MVRFVLDPEGRVTPDVAAKLPGRGVWVSSDAANLSHAMKRGGFSRGFERPVTPPSDLVRHTGTLLQARILGLIGLGRRAGDVVAGFDKVKEELKSLGPGEAHLGVLFGARDGGKDGREKLEGLLRAVAEDDQLFDEDDEDVVASPDVGDQAVQQSQRPVPRSVDIFTSTQLGMALGRDGVIHAWMKPGGFALQCKLEVMRLRGFLGPDGELL
jgi:predicted RNA-binding protein YlxR (DUF448 family)